MSNSPLQTTGHDLVLGRGLTNLPCWEVGRMRGVGGGEGRNDVALSTVRLIYLAGEREGGMIWFLA